MWLVNRQTINNKNNVKWEEDKWLLCCLIWSTMVVTYRKIGLWNTLSEIHIPET